MYATIHSWLLIMFSVLINRNRDDARQLVFLVNLLQWADLALDFYFHSYTWKIWLKQFEMRLDYQKVLRSTVFDLSFWIFDVWKNERDAFANLRRIVALAYRFKLPTNLRNLVFIMGFKCSELVKFAFFLQKNNKNSKFLKKLLKILEQFKI